MQLNGPPPSHPPLTGHPSSASLPPLPPCSFDLLHVMIDEPDAHLDQQIANHILR